MRVLLVAVLALVGVSAAWAITPPPPPPKGDALGTRYMDAKLTRGQEVPAPKGAVGAKGTFHATGTFECREGEQACVSKPGKMTWRLTFSGLSGKAVAAHLHFGKSGKAGAVAVPLCGPCASGAHGTLQITRKVWNAASAKGLYVNVHTAKNPAGEIRGQIVISAVL